MPLPKKPTNKLHEFWVTNISRDKDIMLGDLRLTIRKGESKNLLDSKHFTYSLQQLEDSANKGSIKLKSNCIKVRNIPPQIPIQPGVYTFKDGRYQKTLRSTVKIEEKTFEDLDININEQAEKFAAEEAEDFITAQENAGKPKEPIKPLLIDDFDDEENGFE